MRPILSIFRVWNARNNHLDLSAITKHFDAGKTFVCVRRICPKNRTGRAPFTFVPKSDRFCRRLLDDLRVGIGDVRLVSCTNRVHFGTFSLSTDEISRRGITSWRRRVQNTNAHSNDLYDDAMRPKIEFDTCQTKLRSTILIFTRELNHRKITTPNPYIVCIEQVAGIQHFYYLRLAGAVRNSHLFRIFAKDRQFYCPISISSCCSCIVSLSPLLIMHQCWILSMNARRSFSILLLNFVSSSLRQWDAYRWWGRSRILRSIAKYEQLIR